MLSGNAIIGQSGGPTSVINASLCGILHACLEQKAIRRTLGMRFGIDGIIGLVPGLGDVVAGLLSLIIPFAAWIRGVPYITLVRMAANLGISVLIGSIPLFGDLFGIVVWKPNRRNYALLTRHLNEPRRHTGRDWAFLGILAAALGLIFAIPIVLIVWLVVWLSNH